MNPPAVIRRLFLVAACVAPGWLNITGASAQLSIAATVDTQQVHIGDPIHLSLQVEGLATSQRVLFPSEIDGQLPDDAVARRLPAASRAHEATYDLRLFALGEATIAALQVPVVDGADTVILTTAPIELTVIALRQEGETDLRQIKPPWHIGGGIPVWVVVVLVILGLVALAWILYRYVLRRPPPTTSSNLVTPTDFNREFARIESMGLLERGAVKLYYTHLSDILRRLLEERLQIEGLERTTQEIIVDAQRHPLVTTALHEQIISFLKVADLVKFARAEPQMQEARQMPARGRQIVQQVEAAIQATVDPASTEDRDLMAAQVEG